jgi:hypothetical protein
MGLLPRRGVAPFEAFLEDVQSETKKPGNGIRVFCPSVDSPDSLSSSSIHLAHPQGHELVRIREPLVLGVYLGPTLGFFFLSLIFLPLLLNLDTLMGGTQRKQTRYPGVVPMLWWIGGVRRSDR